MGFIEHRACYHFFFFLQVLTFIVVFVYGVRKDHVHIVWMSVCLCICFYVYMSVFKSMYSFIMYVCYCCWTLLWLPPIGAVRTAYLHRVSLSVCLSIWQHVNMCAWFNADLHGGGDVHGTTRIACIRYVWLWVSEGVCMFDFLSRLSAGWLHTCMYILNLLCQVYC